MWFPVLGWSVLAVVAVAYEYSVFRLFGRLGGLRSDRDLYVYGTLGLASAGLMIGTVFFFNL